MSDEVEIDPEKMFNYDKIKLNEQSEYVKKAISSLLTIGFASFSYQYDYNYGNEIKINDPEIIDNPYEYEDSLIAVNKKNPDYIKNHILKYYNAGNLYDYISGYGSKDEEAVKIFKSLGIEGVFSSNDTINHITIYNNDYTTTSHRINKEKPEPVSDRQLETAQKTGYVQGVCESVLAFNNDENRKIMTEATMTFLSKKLLSEMNVTKDMAQKFANPETYKALEQSVFAPKQEQQLEQTQSQGRGM
jgi:hypothetical protein